MLGKVTYVTLRLLLPVPSLSLFVFYVVTCLLMLVSHSSHLYVCPSLIYYALQEIKNYRTELIPTDIRYIQNVTKCRPQFLQLSRANEEKHRLTD